MKKVFLSVFVLMLLAFSYQNAYSCSCSSPTQKEEFERSEIVFIGKYLRQTEDGVELEVIKSWKGTKKGKVIKLFYFELDGCDYDMNFLAGREYLIYAVKPIKYTDWIKYPAISIDCGRSKSIEDAKTDIKNMGKIAKRKWLFFRF